MGAFESMVRMLESFGIFTYLAHLLLFIMLYYGILYLFDRYTASPRLTKTRKELISFVSAAVLTGVVFIYFSAYATDVGSILGAAVFLIATVFLLMATGLRLGGLDIPSLFRK